MTFIHFGLIIGPIFWCRNVATLCRTICVPLCFCHFHSAIYLFLNWETMSSFSSIKTFLVPGHATIRSLIRDTRCSFHELTHPYSWLLCFATQDSLLSAHARVIPGDSGHFQPHHPEDRPKTRNQHINRTGSGHANLWRCHVRQPPASCVVHYQGVSQQLGKGQGGYSRTDRLLDSKLHSKFLKKHWI